MDTTTNVTDPMDLSETLEQLRQVARNRIADAADLEALGAVEAKSVGRESPIAAARRDLPASPQYVCLVIEFQSRRDDIANSW